VDENEASEIFSLDDSMEVACSIEGSVVLVQNGVRVLDDRAHVISIIRVPSKPSIATIIITRSLGLLPHICARLSVFYGLKLSSLAWT
jgi:hypothetical protein